LDLDAVLWLDDYLSEHYPHSVIVISHDADFLDNICTDILHLEDKKLIHYRGDYTSFKKMHQQKRATLDAQYKKQQDELKALKKKGKTAKEAEEQV
jgi:ATP-binding cassette subfamily F protein 1